MKSKYVSALLSRLSHDARGATAVEYLAVAGLVGLAATLTFREFGAGIDTEAQLAAKHVAALDCAGGACKGDNCFVAGTTVLTPSGERAIESLHEGDEVVSRDEATGELVVEPVLRTFVTPDRPLAQVVLREVGEPIVATPGHPFFIAGKGWTAAADLAPGDAIPSAAGGVVHVDHVALLGQHATVYNFEVAETHTYFVGEASAWVHNVCDRPRGSRLDPPTGYGGSSSRSTSSSRHSYRAAEDDHPPPRRQLPRSDTLGVTRYRPPVNTTPLEPPSYSRPPLQSYAERTGDDVAPSQRAVEDFADHWTGSTSDWDRSGTRGYASRPPPVAPPYTASRPPAYEPVGIPARSNISSDDRRRYGSIDPLPPTSGSVGRAPRPPRRESFSDWQERRRPPLESSYPSSEVPRRPAPAPRPVYEPLPRYSSSSSGRPFWDSDRRSFGGPRPPPGSF